MLTLVFLLLFFEIKIAYAVHIDKYCHAIHKHLCSSQHNISVFAPLNLHSLRRHWRCIVVLKGSKSCSYKIFIFIYKHYIYFIYIYSVLKNVLKWILMYLVLKYNFQKILNMSLPKYILPVSTLAL